MSDRSWFFASQGRQEGPYPENQLRDLIAAGTVTADTLVWSEGMADWQKAGDIPGLLSATPRPPAFARSGAPLTGTGSQDGGAAFNRRWTMGAARPWSGVHDRISAGDSGAVGGDQLLPVDGFPAPRAGAARPRLHRSGWRHLVRVRRAGAFDICRSERRPLPSIHSHSGAGVPVLDDGAMDRCEFQLA